MTVRARARRRDERGFTITEVLLVVVILGLISVPLIMSLFQAVTILPDAQDRTGAAIDSTILADAWSRDVINSQAITLVYSNLTCLNYSGSYVDVSYIGSYDLYNDGTADQVSVYGHAAASVSGHTNGQLEAGEPIKFTVTRYDSVDGVKVMIEGYCAAGAQVLLVENSLAPGENHRRVKLETWLSPEPGGVVQHEVFEAAQGITNLDELPPP